MRGKGFLFAVALLFMVGIAQAGNTPLAHTPVNTLSLMMSEKIKVLCEREYEPVIIEYTPWNVVLNCNEPAKPGGDLSLAPEAPVNVLSLLPNEGINIDCQAGGEWLILESGADYVLLECHFYPK